MWKKIKDIKKNVILVDHIKQMKLFHKLVWPTMSWTYYFFLLIPYYYNRAGEYGYMGQVNPPDLLLSLSALLQRWYIYRYFDQNFYYDIITSET